MINTDKFTDLIIDHEITANQAYILWLLYTKDIINIKKYLVKHQFAQTDFETLEHKGLILNTNPNGSRYNTQNIVVTLEFIEDREKVNPDDAYEELFDIYPSFLIVNNKKIPAKSLTFQDDKLARDYYKNLVSKGKFTHQRILELTGRYKEQHDGYAQVKIDKYITGKLWEEVEKTEDDRPKTRIY